MDGQPFRIIGYLSLIAAVGVSYWVVYTWGFTSAARAAALTSAQQANTAWVERFTLESKLATSDAALASAQQAASVVRTETVTKTEVVYRDRIKVRTVRDCVADSGLFELYNSTLGVSAGGQQ